MTLWAIERVKKMREPAAIASESDDEPTNESRRIRPRVGYTDRVEYAMADGTRPVGTAAFGAHFDEQLAIERHTGPWTVDELNNLVRLSTNKYPMGTPQRWERIADALERKIDDVTTMTARVKNVDPKGAVVVHSIE